MEITPWDPRGGTWYKREDLEHDPVWGVNGAKYRACRYLISRARADGATHVVSAASVRSPQSAMAAVLAAEMDMDCTVIVGGTTPEKAVRHRSIAIAAGAGASIEAIKVGYNPALQSAGARRASELDGGWQLPYGITTDTDVEEFLAVGGEQVLNLPEDVQTLVVPFGSGNTAAGVLHGLSVHGSKNVDRVVLIGIGPIRWEWLLKRIPQLTELPSLINPVAQLGQGPEVELIQIHPWFADYGTRIPFTRDGIDMHPTYEGKVCSWLAQNPQPWDRRDWTMGFWIVGGPV